MTNGVPDRLRNYTVADVDAQRVKWVPERWTATFRGHETAHRDLKKHSEACGGIAREFIHNQAGADAIDLFLMAMAWGYKPKDYGPHRVREILGADGAEKKIRSIVAITRIQGAGLVGMRFSIHTRSII